MHRFAYLCQTTDICLAMKKQLIRILLAVALLAVAYLAERYGGLSRAWLLVVYLVPYLVVGYDVLWEAAEGVAEGDPFDEHFLMSIATIGAMAMGFLPGGEPQFAEAVFVMLFFQVGELFEHYAAGRSRKAINSLVNLRPDEARVERSGVETVVAPTEVRVGETIVLRPGDRIPMDGLVLSGASSVDTSALTGESLPRVVGQGDAVLSGCVNLSGLLKVQVTKTFGQSTAAKVIELVERSAQNKAKGVAFITRFARVYTPVVVLLALLLAILPPLFSGSFVAALPQWTYRALVFLVVSCPCALVISVPLTFFAGIGGASRSGILIKGGNYMEALSRLDTVVFDKTGTLTKGQFEVETVHPDRLSAHELLHIAAHVERHSAHPLAVALRKAYPEEGLDGCRVELMEEQPGCGVRAKVNGKEVLMGNERMMQGAGISLPSCPSCAHKAGTLVHIGIDGHYAGHVLVADKVKDDAPKAVHALRQLGVNRIVMLTGDRPETASIVAKEAGIDDVEAGLLPAGKVAALERIKAQLPAAKRIAFVGDGVNDAPVLARADVGIAMGALGSDAAIEAADVVLMDDKLSGVSTAVRLSRRTVAIARQNAWSAIAVKVAVLGLAGAGWAGMGLAVFADVGIMVLAVLNAMRAFKRPTTA